MKKYIPPWSVNSIATEIGLKIHHDIESTEKYYNSQLEILLETKNLLISNIRNFVKIINEEESLNYLFLFTTSPDFYNKLLNEGIKVRIYKNLDGYFRIAVPQKENVSFISESLKKVLIIWYNQKINNVV